jgi:cytochrome c oxidase subunit 3
MLFAALFFAYAVMRAQAPAWPPAGQAPLPRAWLGINSVALVAATLALRRAVAAARRGAAAGTGTVAALALGVAFLASQIAAWRALIGAGSGPASGIYGSVFFAISGLHALHVVGGLVALAVVSSGGGDARRLRACALYWDFVLAVWLVFYAGACLA